MFRFCDWFRFLFCLSFSFNHRRQLSCQIHINNTETIVHESECRKAGRAWNPPNANINHIVFIRDPLDRFLSGFLDKCVDFHSNPTNEQHCEPSIIFQGDGKEIDALTKDFKAKDPKRLFETYVVSFSFFIFGVVNFICEMKNE